MPIYEYKCNECGKIDEVIQKISDEPLTECRFCSGKVHKLISKSTFHLKGSGWYVTDYAKKDGKEPSKQPSGSSKTDDNSSSKVKDSSDSSKVESSSKVENSSKTGNSSVVDKK